jgi:hypothetical protein
MVVLMKKRERERRDILSGDFVIHVRRTATA